MNEEKLIFFDIDGTLYNDEKVLPDTTKEAIMQVKAQGHKVAIATGRAPYMFQDLLDQLGIDAYVSFNGSYVVVEGEVVLKKPLQLEALERIYDYAKAHQHAMVFMDHQGARTDIQEHPRIAECLGSLKMPYPTVCEQPIKGKIYQALLFTKEGESPKYEEVYDTFDFVRWHELSTDLLPAGGSKAIGIEEAANAMGIPMSKTVAFGDGLNDIEMLQAVGVGVAMGNSLEETKKVADMMTTTVDCNGIQNGLRKLGLIPSV